MSCLDDELTKLCMHVIVYLGKFSLSLSLTKLLLLLLIFHLVDLIFLDSIGGYDMEEKAARAYDQAALKYWGPSTHINFPVHFITLF